LECQASVQWQDRSHTNLHSWHTQCSGQLSQQANDNALKQTARGWHKLLQLVIKDQGKTERQSKSQ
jgi:hypothetical protein